jgi:hypothetical protein
MYTPGLKVSSKTLWRIQRRLPLPGEVLVTEGQVVTAQQIVARTLLPGEVTPCAVARQLGANPRTLPNLMLRQVGETLQRGDVLARSSGFLGWFTKEYPAPQSGTIETISRVTGQVMLRSDPAPLNLLAYMSGRVIEVFPQVGVTIEAEVSIVQGIFGIGGETYGLLFKASQSRSDSLTIELIQSAPIGSVILGGGRVTASVVRAAIARGIAAIVTGGIDDEDLRQLLGYDLGVAITGSETIGITLIITEGFGDIAMADRTFSILALHAGQQVSVNGATQIRAGVMRPEIIAPAIDATAKTQPADSSSSGDQPRVEGQLTIGAAIRVVRDPYFGVLGHVSDLPQSPQSLASGSKARVLEVATASGARLIVPRANVELVEG